MINGRALGRELVALSTCPWVQEVAMRTFAASVGLRSTTRIPRHVFARSGTYRRYLVSAALTLQAEFNCYCDTCMRVRAERR